MKRIPMCFVIILWLLLLNSACFAGMLNVIITVKATFIDDTHIEIEGSANLPDETIFYSTVWDSPSDEARLIANIGHDRNELIYVKNGKFKIVRTPEKGQLFKKNHMVMLFLSPDAQPDKVKNIIGDKGQFLRGSCVKKIGKGLYNINIDNIPLLE